ncbi:hypothetical protein [Brachyspira pilosicoli]|uniref:hypothetical protein n=1 Tax=Brachyspira pilosicoli TaxID=52584 RepID=UPI003007538F
MKKHLLTLMMLLSILGISCENKPTAPNTSNPNNTIPAEIFNNNFQFGGFGNVSKIIIENNNNINMTLDKTFLYIDKSMVNKISDTEYKIIGNAPITSISYNGITSAKSTAVLESEVNFDIILNIIDDRLSISGKVNQDNVKSENAPKLPNNDLSQYAGTYTESSGAYKFYIDSEGKVIEIISAPNEGVNAEYIYKERLIKENENVYTLISALEDKKYPITEAEADTLIMEKAFEYWGIRIKYNFTFNGNTLTVENDTVSIYNSPDYDIKKAAEDPSYIENIDYSQFKLELKPKSTTIYTKK